MPTVETNGVETYYHDYGEGQPIVVLHGATADHQVWAEQLQPLVDDYRVISYDLRGHGQTGGSDLEEYTIDTYVNDLAAFIEALDLDHPIILGHSLGGMIGYVFADAHPDKLSALITVGARTPESFSTSEQILMTAQARVVMPLMEYDWVLNTALWAQQKLFGDNSTPDRDKLGELRESHKCETRELKSDERSKIVQASREYFSSSWSWELSEVPVMVLYGEDEPFIKPHVDFLETKLTDCVTAEIPEASHNSQLDNPEFIRTRIRDFIVSMPNGHEQGTADP